MTVMVLICGLTDCWVDHLENGVSVTTTYHRYHSISDQLPNQAIPGTISTENTVVSMVFGNQKSRLDYAEIPYDASIFP
jgi:hypothetical protein